MSLQYLHHCESGTLVEILYTCSQEPQERVAHLVVLALPQLLYWQGVLGGAFSEGAPDPVGLLYPLN